MHVNMWRRLTKHLSIVKWWRKKTFHTSEDYFIIQTLCNLAHCWNCSPGSVKVYIFIISQPWLIYIYEKHVSLLKTHLNYAFSIVQLKFIQWFWKRTCSKNVVFNLLFRFFIFFLNGVAVYFQNKSGIILFLDCCQFITTKTDND